MHMRAPLGTRIEAAGRIASLVSIDIEQKLLPGKVEGIVSNCGLPVGPHNMAFIPTPTIGAQDCDITINLKDDTLSRLGLSSDLAQGGSMESVTQEQSSRSSQPISQQRFSNFGTPSPIDVQINGGDQWESYEFARKLASKLRKVSGAVDVVIQQTMRTSTLLVEGNRSLGLGVNLTEKDIAENLVMTLSGSQQIDQQFWLDQRTGNSYQINVYTPQPQMTRMQDLITVPINKAEGEWTPQRMQLLGSVATVSAVGTPASSPTETSCRCSIFMFGRDPGSWRRLGGREGGRGQMEHELPRGASLRFMEAETMHTPISN